MSTRYNYTGGLITEGLVLNLDAAKRDSYPGSGTLWRDLSGNGNNGTLTNGPTYTGVSKDAAIVFDGTNDYVDISGSSISSFRTDDFGISVWVNFNNLISSSYRDIIGSSNNTAYLGANKSGWVCSYYSIAGQFRFSYQSSNTWIFEQGFSSKIIQSQWYCINYIRNSGIVTFYQNGSPVFSSTITTNLISTEPFIRLGGGYGSGGGLVNGLIPQAQIYNRALSQFEIFQNFNSMKGRYGIPDIVTDGLVLNLDAGNPYSYLQGSSGTTWTDVSGQGNNGTLINGASYSNGAIVFDGVDDYARVPYSVSLNPETITVNVWINRTQAINYAHFIGLPVNNFTWSPPYMSYGVEYIGTSNTISFVLGFTNNTFAYTDFNLSFGNNRWFNFTASYDRSSVKIYIDGVLVVTRAETRSMFQSTADFYVGAINSSAQYPLNGKIGVTQVYNRSLSANEIQQNFQSLRGRYGI